MSYIEKINSNNNIIDEYFLIYNKYKLKYGENTIIGMQVGSFIEYYQTLVDGYNLQKLSDILNIIVSKKNKQIIEISNKNCYILGYPVIAHQKYLKILLEYNYIVVFVEQITPPPNVQRAITNIYTKSMYIDDTNNQDTNNILSIYIEEIDKGNLIIGLAILDISTGYTNVHEIYSIKDDENICLDDTIRYIYSYNVKEIVITTNNLKKYTLDELLNYLEISDKTYHHQTISQIISKKPLFKLSYQQEILNKIYINNTLLTTIEYLDLENIAYARLSFIILLNYAYDHSHNIINNINKPEIYNNDRYLHLGNNALFQLNIITFDKDNLTGIYNKETKYKSLFDVINKVSTNMGRRLLKDSLCNPLTNINDIQNRYNMIRNLLKDNIWEIIEKKLIGINDIEKISRKIYLNIINPIELYTWINSILITSELFNFILLNKIDLYLPEDINIKILLGNIINMLEEFVNMFNIEELQKYFINDINGLIFKNGKYKDIDLLNKKIQICNNYMEAVAWGLGQYLDSQLKTNNDNLIKIEYNDREKHYLVLTKRRSDVLQQLLDKNEIIKFKYQDIEYLINKNELEFKHLPKGNNCKIFIKELNKNSSKFLDYQDELKILQKKYYIDFLIHITNKYKKIINDTSYLVALIDFLTSASHCIVKYHYTIPIIENKFNDKSYIDAIDLRHPLIEVLHKDTEFIPNNINLGDKQDGIILFGINGGGKTSYIKSIGISIIMAQAGMGVPAKNFKYYIYNDLYTRISGNDNLFKKMSSFTIEMNELRAILKRSNNNTLVICDEISRGTEYSSGLIIISTIIDILANKKVSFITSSHIHNIIDIKRIKDLKNIGYFYLDINYDEKNNVIIYDRKIKEGIMKNINYGLDIAKYLMMNDNFLKVANEIKKEINEDYNIVNPKVSKYNSNVFIDQCQICKHKPKSNEIPLEIHHINYQKFFNENKINNDNFHIMNKNDKYNLVCICSKCHDLIHNNKIIINNWKDSNLPNKLEWIDH